MNDTRFFVKAEDVGRFAEVHNWDSERNRLVQRPHRTDRPSYLDSARLESGGGGLVSSTHDYARFLQLLVNEGELDGTRLLTPESIRIMRTNSLRDGLNLRGSLTSQGQAGQGFGVDFAVIIDPEKANSPNSPGTYYWGGAAGTWFWVEPTVWQPKTVTAWVPTPEGPVSVTTTATPTKLVFHPGDGFRGNGDKTCTGPGPKWFSMFGDLSPSACMYSYRHSSAINSSGLFSASLSIIWRVAWRSNSGASGTLPNVITSSSHQMNIREFQALVTS